MERSREVENTAIVYAFDNPRAKHIFLNDPEKVGIPHSAFPNMEALYNSYTRKEPRSSALVAGFVITGW